MSRMTSREDRHTGPSAAERRARSGARRALAEHHEQAEEGKGADHSRNRDYSDDGIDPALVGSASEAHVLGNRVTCTTLLTLVLFGGSDLWQVLRVRRL